MGEIKEIDQFEKRKILFKGKRVRGDGKWIYGYYWFIEEHFLDSVLNNKHFIKSINNGIDYEVIPETVGQFTGLYDINGKEIFEGDIVKELDYGHYTYQVEWKDTSCGFEPFSDSEENCHHCDGGLDSRRCEVIGNIYDNPELLEVE